MPVFHVFVDAAADNSTVGKERLANAIAEHYGLPVAELRARIASGRFRVKGNCDGATADMYVRDLTRLGARCSIEEATPQNKANTPLPFPAVTPGAATTTGVPPTPPSTTLPPPTRSATPATSILPPAAPRPSQPPPLGGYQSGLSAAFSAEAPVASLGALEGNGDIAFTLSSVDGADDDAPPPPKPQVFEPPGSIGPPPSKPTTAPKKSKPAASDAPIDMFAPPDSQAAELKMELAPEEVERSARKRATTPPSVPVVEPEPTPGPAASSARYSRPSMQVPNVSEPMASSPKLPAVLANPNGRFAIGVAIAIVLGFIPAHLVASAREKSAFASVDNKVLATQQEADTPDAYAALDTFRTDQLNRKQDDRRTIAIMALLIWGVVGAGVGYVWFRRIPWDRLDA